MTYLALLRAVNVGGKGIVPMSLIQAAFGELGLTDVRTYINSGNVLFASPVTDVARLTTSIEAGLERATGLAISVLVMDADALRSVVDAVPLEWVDDKTMRTYVLLLWPDVDDGTVLEHLPARPGVDELIYTPGAVIWRVDRENVSRSRLNRVMGTPLYKRMTIRSVNTMRKLRAMVEAP